MQPSCVADAVLFVELHDAVLFGKLLKRFHLLGSGTEGNIGALIIRIGVPIQGSIRLLQGYYDIGALTIRIGFWVLGYMTL